MNTRQLFLRPFSSTTTQIKHITNAKGPQIKTNKPVYFNQKPLLTYLDYIKIKWH